MKRRKFIKENSLLAGMIAFSIYPAQDQNVPKPTFLVVSG